mgnify:CR=1 FL=1
MADFNGYCSVLPAREVVISTLGVMLNIDSDSDGGAVDLRNAIKTAKRDDGKPLFTLLRAVSLMVFFALCCQCMATLATIKRETNGWKWPAITFAYMTLLAYLSSVSVYQIGIRFGLN